jgi:hypothetical protein
MNKPVESVLLEQEEQRGKKSTIEEVFSFQSAMMVKYRPAKK